MTVAFDHYNGVSSQGYHATFALYDDGTPGEVFVNSSQKSGSEADVNASDAAIAASLALQYGCPVEVLRLALRRNPNGDPMGPLSHALDVIVEDMRRK